jgi:4,5-DOPA dioxygenase extradiol
VLVIGSGFMTHGLPFVTREMFLGEIPAWSSDFDTWVADALARGRRRPAGQLPAGARHAVRASDADHYTPLFIALGASADPQAPVRTTIDGYMMGFSKRSFQTL